MLDEVLRKNIQKKDGEIGKQTKWDRSTEYVIEKVKLDKSKRSSYSPVVFKYGCLLEIYLELWPKNPQYLGICIFQKIRR